MKKISKEKKILKTNKPWEGFRSFLRRSKRLESEQWNLSTKITKSFFDIWWWRRKDFYYSLRQILNVPHRKVVFFFSFFFYSASINWVIFLLTSSHEKGQVIILTVKVSSPLSFLSSLNLLKNWSLFQKFCSLIPR